VDVQEGEPAPADRTPVYVLAGSELLLGRRSDVKDIHPEVPLDEDAGVSHRHAKILREGDGWSVLDLGSSNGTELNGNLLGPGTRARLKAGDELRLGIRTLIRVRER
jgi:pSer/pThr/pTyr-binding forkhead associated (FHA) protein